MRRLSTLDSPAGVREQQARREFRSLKMNKMSISDSDYFAKTVALVETIGLHDIHNIDDNDVVAAAEGIADEANTMLPVVAKKESLWHRKKFEIEHRREEGCFIRRLEKKIALESYEIRECVATKANCFSALVSNKKFSKDRYRSFPGHREERIATVESTARYSRDPRLRNKMCYICHKFVMAGKGEINCASCPVVSHDRCFIDLATFYDSSSSSSTTSTAKFCVFCHSDLIAHNDQARRKYRIHVYNHRRESAALIIQCFFRMAAVRSLFLMLRRCYLTNSYCYTSRAPNPTPNPTPNPNPSDAFSDCKGGFVANFSGAVSAKRL